MAWTFCIDTYSLKKLKMEKGKNSFVIHLYFFTIWCVDKSMIDFISQRRAKAYKQEDHRHKLN